MANELALNLAAVARNAKWSMQAGIIKTIIETSPFLNMLPVRSIQNLIHTWVTREKLPKTQTRKIGQPYSAQDISIKGQGQIGLSIYGGSFGLDRQLADIPTIDGTMEVSEQITDYFESASLEIKRTFVKGNAAKNPGEADGLEVLTPKVQTLDFLTASGDTIANATEEQLINMIEKLIDLLIGAPSAILTNKSVLSSIRAKALADSNTRLGEVFRSTYIPIPGPTGEPINIRGALWDNRIPFIPMDDDSEGNPVLGFDEKSTDKANADCTSMYAVIMEPRMVELVQKYADGARIYTKPGDVGDIYDIDYPLAPWKKHDKATARLRNIRKPV